MCGENPESPCLCVTDFHPSALSLYKREYDALYYDFALQNAKENKENK